MQIRIEGNGPRHLLVLPGWRLDSKTEIPDWLPILAERSNWRGVFPDLPGTGGSRCLRDGVANQRDVLARVLRLLDGETLSGEPLAVAGTSNGAALALAVARNRPGNVRGLAVRVPMLEPNDDARLAAGQQQWELAFQRLPIGYREAHGRKIRELWNPAREERADDHFLRSIREDPSLYALPEAVEPLPDFSRPTLVVLGRQDGTVGWQHAWSLLGNLPRATVAILDRAGHALPVGERQVQLWRALAHDWLDRVDDEWDVAPVSGL